MPVMSNERYLAGVLERILEAAREAFFDEFGHESNCPSKVLFRYGPEGIPKGKVAWWEPATAWEPEEIRLDPAFREPEAALVHEVIHVVLNSPCSGEADTEHHGDKFHALADRLGLPRELRH